MKGWFKSPNAMLDDITGDVISPQAAVILQSIIRFTEGMKGRDWAQIPHSFFMRKTQTKRRETIAKYLSELIDNELIITKKENGKTTSYSINWQCHYWFNTVKPEIIEVKTSTNKPVRFNRTSTLQPLSPVRLIRTGLLETSTFHPYAYKDTMKDSNKDIYNATKKKEVALPEKQKRKRKHDIPSEFTVTDTQQKKCNEYGIISSDLVAEFDNHHSSKGNQFVDWSKAFSTWITNHIRFNKLTPINQSQVNQNEKHQPANSQPNHFDKLRAEIAAKYGTSEQPRDIRTISEATGNDNPYV